jgi:hypothetical protein
MATESDFFAHIMTLCEDSYDDDDCEIMSESKLIILIEEIKELIKKAMANPVDGIDLVSRLDNLQAKILEKKDREDRIEQEEYRCKLEKEKAKKQYEQDHPDDPIVIENKKKRKESHANARLIFSSITTCDDEKLQKTCDEIFERSYEKLYEKKE